MSGECPEKLQDNASAKFGRVTNPKARIKGRPGQSFRGEIRWRGRNNRTNFKIIVNIEMTSIGKAGAFPLIQRRNPHSNVAKHYESADRVSSNRRKLTAAGLCMCSRSAAGVSKLATPYKRSHASILGANCTCAD